MGSRHSRAASESAHWALRTPNAAPLNPTVNMHSLHAPEWPPAGGCSALFKLHSLVCRREAERPQRALAA
jgi:hypothetical protein